MARQEKKAETQKLVEQILAATLRMSEEQPQYTPEEIEEATRDIEEIMSELRANPPYPTVEAFMAVSRGYPHDLD